LKLTVQIPSLIDPLIPTQANKKQA